VCAGNETGDIEQFYGDGSSAFDTGAIVGFAAVGEIEARAGAGDLEVADCALGVDGRESGDTLSAYDAVRVRTEAVV
jgi:hypothetical protein